MLTATTRIAYAQVDSFLDMLEEKYVQMVPRNIRYFIKQEKDTRDDIRIVPDVPIKQQNLTDEALALIAYLNLNYWCQDQSEREKLIEKYKENDEKYEKNLRYYQHGADDIFKKDNDSFNSSNTTNIEAPKADEGKTNSTALVQYKKDNIFITILNKIKSKFIK